VETAVISVVISTLDRPTLLARALDALARGTRRPDEVVVVDQGSPGPVEDVLAARRAAGLHIVHVTQERRGLSASQNLGVRTATSPIVAVLDDDCVPDAHWVESIDAVFAAGEAPDLVGGRILPLPPSGDRVVAVASRTSERAGEYRWPALPWLVGSGGNFAVRRERYLQVGGNDERLGTGSAGRAGNDIDLFYRVMRDGGVARYDPALLVHHERSTVAERRARRGSYGFGVGACVGRWLRDGDRWAWRVLGSWFRLRARSARRRRSIAALAEEARVVGGTALGLVYGLRAGRSWGS
jgi:glycosyltransferase involved in cell wall biosynthesis